jgi:hypothetical protein
VHFHPIGLDTMESGTPCNGVFDRVLAAARQHIGEIMEKSPGRSNRLPIQWAVAAVVVRAVREARAGGRGHDTCLGRR